MTEFAVVHTDFPEGSRAGRALGLQITEAMQQPPDVVLLFASPLYDHALLLRALKQSSQASIILGCSSTGEFAPGLRGTGMACALALRSSEMLFTLSTGRRLHTHPHLAAQQVMASLHSQPMARYPYRSLLLFFDGLSFQSGDFLYRLTQLMRGSHQFFGAAAGDDGQFRSTSVFAQTKVLPDTAVALEILSQKPVGIGVQHGWRSASRLKRITSAEGRRIFCIDEQPAVEAFLQHAYETEQEFDTTNPSPFFRCNILGVVRDTSSYMLRAPVALHPDGSISCASEIRQGAEFHFMTSTIETVTRAAHEASMMAVQHLYGCTPGAALFFDCVSTKRRMGDQFLQELRAFKEVIETPCYLGCAVHGQISRDTGQYGDFFNCTPIVCIFPA